MALFNKDWNTYKTNWQQGFSQNGFAGGVKSIFQSSSQNSVISKDQVQILRNWNNAVAHGCTNQETFNRIIANADDNTKMYFAGLNKGKGSIEGLKNAQNVAKQSTIGLTIAQTALNMAISMGLMAAISLAIKGFDKLINSAKRASEAADEAFSDTNEKVQQNEEEAKSLDELISKYKELKENGNLDIDGRKEVKELQNDIADLVGTQAKNLDLVNGKLDDEIKKLDEISAKEAKRAYETATANYNNSQKANAEATGDDSFLFVDGYAYTGKREKEAEKILKDAGFSSNVQSGGFFGNTLFVMDSFDNNMKELKGAQEKADYLQSMIDVLEQNGQRATDLYAGLIKQRDAYLKYIDNQQNAANSLVNSWITYSQFSNEELSKINVDSVESFDTYRQKMIEEAKNDESIGKILADGTLSDEDLEKAVNDFMATSLNFSKWYEQWLGNVQGSTSNNETDISSTFTTFKSLWKSIGKGDDDASKAAKSAKEEILKLAEAGKLTEKAFKKSSIADTFINAGYSIEEATKKINRMVDSSKQLSSLKSSISSIQDAYQEKKDNKVASSSTLAGMEDTFGKLSSWEKYKNILGSTSSTLKECKIAQNELATEFVYSNNFLSQLTSKNKEYYTSQLKELGIANAQSIVENTLKAKKQALANETKALEAATSDLSSETSNASEKFLEQANMTDLARVELVNLIAQQKIFEGQGIDTTAKVEQLNKLAEAYFGVANAIQISTAMGNDPRYYKNSEDYTKAIEEEWNKLISEQTKISIDPVKVSPKNDTKDKSSKSKSKSKSSDTKQEIDWLSRRLTRMQSIIDLTASKLKNLFKIDEKENNINKQIKQTTKLINQYRHAYDVYMGKANKVAKASGKGKNKVPALSKDIINKIQSGEFTKDSYDKLIKKYGKDYADKINEYIDYYDKAQDSLKNKEEQIANKRELKKSKIQLRIDDKQANIDLMEAQKENATSASDKNKILDDELKAYKKLYKEKKKLANEDEDDTEIKRLEEEKKQKEKEIKIEKHQNNIDEKQSALDLLEAQKEIVTSAADKNAIIDQELALKREICDKELAIAKLNGDQNEQERLKKQLLFEEKKTQLEQIANTKDEFDLKKNALSRDEAKLQQQIAENEAKGVGQSVKDYRKQIALSEERQKELRDEKEYWEAQLAEQLASGKIVANESDAAYKELKDNIASCDEGISQCTVDQINWNKAIKEMDYKNYETLLDLLDMAYKKLENLKSIREAHGKELTNDEILKQIEIDDKIINSSKSAMESAKKNLSDAFKEGEYGFTLNTDQIDKFMDYLEYMPEQIPDLMKEFGIENFNKETYKGAFDEINKFTTANDSWVQALVDAEGLSDEIGQKIINHANEYLEALKKQKDYKDRIFAIEKAQYDLEKAKNNLTKKVWDGQQWVYTADTEAVQSAQESLDNAKFEEFNNSIQDLIEVLEQFIKDFNIYDDNGNMINKPEVILEKGVLGEYTIADIQKIFTDKVLDTSKLSGLMSNIQYAMPNVSIPNINLPDIQSRAMNQTVNYDKIELILPNITDASTGAQLAKSFVNELKNLPSYAKQYDWNK